MKNLFISVLFFTLFIVKPTRTKIRNFTIRINSLDFKELQDKISRPITVLSSVKLHASITDQFVEVFAQEVRLNSIPSMKN